MIDAFRFLAPGAAKEPLETDPEQIRQRYRKIRLSVIVSLTLGYGFFYTCRLGLAVVKKPLIDGGIFTVQELGWIGAAFLWGYGFGKIINGIIADRVNVRLFIPLALAISAVINVVMGFNTAAAIAIVLWTFNGLFQGAGAPASVVSISHWFSGKNRGTMYGLWSTAHSFGEGMTYFGTAALVAATTWNAAFIGPGLLCLVVAFAMYFGLRDRPETEGLPPVDEHPDEAPPSDAEPDESEPKATMTATQAQLLILKMPTIWIIGLASAAMYVSRYAINNWGVLYLQEEHGLTLLEAGGLIGINTIAGIGGCFVYGIVSDLVFKGRRPPLTLIFGILEIVGLFIVFFAPQGNMVVLTIGFILYGFTLSGLLAVLGGLFAVDIAPKEATGAAMGMMGVCSYLGAGMQEVVSGWLIERGSTVIDETTTSYDFSGPIMFWIGASMVSLVLAASLWRVRTRA